MEAKIIVALTSRKFDFVSMYPGAPYAVYALSSKPVDDMPMQVSLST
jgi:hypothetical protein